MQRGCLVVIGGPVIARKLGHAAQQAFFRAGPNQHMAIRAADPEGCAKAAGTRRFWQFARKPLRVAAQAGGAAFSERAKHASRASGRADRCAKVHHGLRIVTRARIRRQRRCVHADDRFRLGQRHRNCKQPSDNSLNICVNYDGFLIKRNSCYRCCRVSADTRQPHQRRRIARKSPAMVAHHCARAGMQVARPRIIAKPGPFLHDRRNRRGGQRANCWPACQKPRVIGLDRRHSRLLEHDFRQPDGVWVRPQARQRPPWQQPAMQVVPGQQQLRGGGLAGQFRLGSVGALG